MERFHNFFENVPIGLYRSTPEGILVDVNPAMVKILGYPDRNSLLKVRAQDLFVDIQERFVQQSVLDEEGVVTYSEIRLRCYDGRQIWARDCMRLITSDDGEVFYEGSLEDITQQKISQSDLVTSEANLQAILNSHPFAYILIDPDIRIRAMNRKAIKLGKRLFGHEIVEGSYLPDFMNDKDLSRFLHYYNRALAGQSSVTEYHFISTEGEERFAELHWDPALTDQGEVVGILFSLVDITDNKAIERQIQSLYQAEIEQRQIAEVLRETGTALSYSLDYATILDQILELVAKVVPYDTGRVSIVEGNRIRIARIKNRSSLDIPILDQMKNITFEIDQTPNLKWIFENRQSMVIPDTQQYPGWLRIEGTEYIRSWIGVPIQAHGEWIALFSLDKAEPNFFTGEHARQLEAFAGQTALALQNAHLFETVQRRAREADTLRQAAAAVTTELDLDHVLERILISLKKVLQFDKARIYLLEDNELKIVANSDSSPEQMVTSEKMAVINSLFRQSLATSQPVILSAQEAERIFRQSEESLAPLSWLGIPLHLRGRAIGFLTIEAQSPEAYMINDASLAQAFANEATIALENARLFEELQRLATTDPLTEVLNRRHFIHLAKMELQRARRYRQPLSIILFDIDSFKSVNDSYGHAVGDQVLRNMAKVCMNNLRQVDLFGRYGGEEFMALLPNTSISGALKTAERLRAQIAQNPTQTERGLVYISASFGAAEVDDSCQDIDTLLLYADRAAYAAKQKGKNQVSVQESHPDLS
ncbi:MAG: diguanylate cyclase [Anaerolineales bacterium]|nr:diguanylate cyclase [Anaerolineales bacterium]